MDYKSRITLEPGKRSGKPCIRGMRITVQDVLGYLAAGMTAEQILADFSYLEREISSPVWRMRPTLKSTRCSPGDEAPLRPESVSLASEETRRRLSRIRPY
jgi:uncharacterized protein (DUF433 family)